MKSELFLAAALPPRPRSLPEERGCWERNGFGFWRFAWKRLGRVLRVCPAVSAASIVGYM